jgi:flagellar operon protein
MIDILQGISATPPPRRRGAGPPSSTVTSFEDLLRSAQAPVAEPTAPEAAPVLSFSKHAQARLQSRGIELDTGQMTRLNDSVEKLAGKGAKESLVLLDDHAFIVGVPKRKVITAMSRNEAMGNVFTKLDSVLLAA